MYRGPGELGSCPEVAQKFLNSSSGSRDIRPNIGQVWSVWILVWGKVGQRRPTSGRVRQHFAKMGGQVCRTLAEVGASVWLHLVVFGMRSENVGRHRPTFGRIRPTWEDLGRMCCHRCTINPPSAEIRLGQGAVTWGRSCSRARTPSDVPPMYYQCTTDVPPMHHRSTSFLQIRACETGSGILLGAPPPPDFGPTFPTLQKVGSRCPELDS